MINIEGSALVKINSDGGGRSASPKAPGIPDEAKKPEALPKFKKKVADDLGRKR